MAKAHQLVELNEEEEARTRPLSWRLIKRLFSTLGPQIWIMLLANVFCMLCVLGEILIIRRVGALVEREDLLTAVGISLVLPLAAVCLMNRVFGYSQFALTMYVSNRAVERLRIQFYERLQTMSKRFFDEHKAGWLVARGTGDMVTIADFLSFALMICIFILTTLVFAFGFMVTTSPRMVLVAAVVSPLIVLLITWFKRAMTEAQRDYRAQNSSMVSYLAETIKGIRVVQAFNREEFNLDTYQDLNEENCHLGVRAARLMAIFMPSFDALAVLSIAALMAVGGYLMNSGYTTLSGEPLDASVLVPFIFYTVMMQNQTRMGIELYNLAITAMASAERIFEVIDMDPEVLDPVEPKPLDCMTGALAFKEVHFRYNDETDWVLRGVNLNVKAQETIALVGETGAGKSTMAHLMARFYDPVQGAIKLDGVDLRDFSQKALHQRMGIVLQDGFLFSGSVMDNIRFRRPGLSDAEVKAICRELGTYDAIANLPDGFDTVVYEGGASMSVGQRQIISLSRALAADPRILILDEATSAIDVHTERILDVALEHLRQDRTTIIIAHRLSTIRSADRILVIGEGGILEQGNHDALMEQHGKYHELIHASVEHLPD